MQDKCKSYEDEVLRLRKIHEQDNQKLKTRIKFLEKLVRRADYMTNTYFDMVNRMRDMMIESFEALLKSETYKFAHLDVPLQFNDIKTMLRSEEMLEFTKNRRIFQKAIYQIDELQKSSMQQHQNLYNRILEKLGKDLSSLEPSQLSRNELFQQLCETAKNTSQDNQKEITEVIQKKVNSSQVLAGFSNMVITESINSVEVKQEQDIQVNTVLEEEEESIFIKRVLDEEEESNIDKSSHNNGASPREINLEIDPRESSEENTPDNTNQSRDSASKKIGTLKKEIHNIECKYQAKMGELKSAASELEILQQELLSESDKMKSINEQYSLKIEEIKETKLMIEQLSKQQIDESPSLENLDLELQEITQKRAELETKLEERQSILLEKQQELNSESKFKLELINQIEQINSTIMFIEQEIETSAENTEQVTLHVNSIQNKKVEAKEKLMNAQNRLNDITIVLSRNIEELEKLQSLTMEMLDSECETPKRKKKDSPFEKLTEAVKREEDLRKLVHSRLLELQDAAAQLEEKAENRDRAKRVIMQDLSGVYNKLKNHLEDIDVLSELQSNIENKLREVKNVSSSFSTEDLMSQLSKINKYTQSISDNLLDITTTLSNQEARSSAVKVMKDTVIRLEGLFSSSISTLSTVSGIESRTNQILREESNMLKEIELLVVERIEEEKIHLNRLEETENTLHHIRSKSLRIREEVKKIEGKIEILKELNVKKTIILNKENEFLSDLEITLLEDTREFEKLSVQKQEDVFLAFKEALSEMNLNEKSNLLSLLITLADNTLASMGIRKGSLNNIITDKQYEALLASEETESLNYLLIESLKDEVLSRVSISSEAHEQLETSFDHLKIDGKMNVMRLFASFVFNNESFISLAGETSSGSSKEWRNSLKHIANLVSYMMKTSSFFINIYNFFIKDYIENIEKAGKIKQLGMTFSEKVFARHKDLIEIVKDYESEEKCSFENFSLFAKRISEKGKSELSCQEDYISQLNTILREDNSV